MPTATCENCLRLIGESEKMFRYEDRVLCAPCTATLAGIPEGRLSGVERSAALTRRPPRAKASAWLWVAVVAASLTMTWLTVRLTASRFTHRSTVTQTTTANWRVYSASQPQQASPLQSRYDAFIAAATRDEDRRDYGSAIRALESARQLQASDHRVAPPRGRPIVDRLAYLQALNAVSATDGDSTPRLLQLGYADLRKRRLDSAEKRLTAALEQSPDNPQALFGLAVLRGQTNGPRDGRELLERAVAADAFGAKLALGALLVRADAPRAAELLAGHLSASKTLDVDAVRLLGLALQICQDGRPHSPSLASAKQVFQNHAAAVGVRSEDVDRYVQLKRKADEAADRQVMIDAAYDAALHAAKPDFDLINRLKVQRLRTAAENEKAAAALTADGGPGRAAAERMRAWEPREEWPEMMLRRIDATTSP